MAGVGIDLQPGQKHGRQPEKLIIVNRDISDRKRAWEALSLSEASFRSVIENAPYGIYRANASGMFLRVNPALQKMLGYATQEELSHANLATDIYRNPEEHRRANELFAGTTGFDVEVEWKRKDGTPLKARCSGRLIEDEQGESHGEARAGAAAAHGGEDGSSGTAVRRDRARFQ